jgi:hypothetical protein
MMSSPTTSPPTRASTSTTATASKAEGSNWTKASGKLSLRMKGQTHTATRLTARLVVEDLGITAQPGDWLVNNLRGLVTAVIAPKDFPGAYEVIQEGTLTLSRTDREGLEETLGIGTTRTPLDLAHAVGRLARIQIGEIVVPFTPGQLEELKHRAEKRGQTVQQAMQAVVDRLKDEIFWKG